MTKIYPIDSDRRFKVTSKGIFIKICRQRHLFFFWASESTIFIRLDGVDMFPKIWWAELSGAKIEQWKPNLFNLDRRIAELIKEIRVVEKEYKEAEEAVKKVMNEPLPSTAEEFKQIVKRRNPGARTLFHEGYCYILSRDSVTLGSGDTEDEAWENTYNKYN